MRVRSLVSAALAAAVAVWLAACGGASTPEAVEAPTAELDATTPPLSFDGLEDEAETTIEAGAPADDGLFPEVVAVAATSIDGVEWRFDVTLSSPYDTPERYADAWRVVDANGLELGVRELAHDHANEQPFTRSLSGVVVDPAESTVFVEGRDQVNGWSGERFEVVLER